MKHDPSPIAKLHALISEKGSFARFSLVVKTGQHLQFTVKYGEMGALVKFFSNAAQTMTERLQGAGEVFAAKVMSESLSQPAEVSAFALGRDAETGETLLWIETSGAGAFPLRLPDQALASLRASLREHDAALDEGAEADRRLAAE